MDDRCSCASLPAATLELPAGPEQRLTGSDRDDLPWVDLHVEADAALRLRLPARVSESATVEIRSLDATGRVVDRRDGPLAPHDTTLLAPLQPRVEAKGQRGPSELFQALFLQPFGPRALASYVAHAEEDTAEPIGIAQEDIARMRLLLRHTAEIDRARRLGTVASGYGIGGLAIGLGGWMLSTGVDFKTPKIDSYIGLGLMIGGAVDVLLATVLAVSSSKGERIFRDFELHMADPSADQAQIVARTERELFRLYNNERCERRLQLAFSWILAGVGSLGLGLSAAPLHADPMASSTG